MKKKIQAIKLNRLNQPNSNQNINPIEQPLQDTLILSLLKTQEATNRLLESMTQGQQEIITTLQDSQNLLARVARIEGALYKKINEGQMNESLYQTMKSENKLSRKQFSPTVFKSKSPTKEKSKSKEHIAQSSNEQKLANISKCDHFQNKAPEQFRDITIKIPIPSTVLSLQSKLSLPELQAILRIWIADLFTCLSKATFAGYYQQKKLSQQQSKIYFSRNLIFNIIKLIQLTKQYQIDIWKKQGRKMIRMFEAGSKKVINFLKLKYPQKKKMLYDPEMEKMIETFDDSQNIDFDIIYNSGCSFNNKQQTWAQIKIFINKLLKEIKSNHERFTAEMIDIFTICKNKSGDKNNDKDRQNEKQKYILKNLIGSKIDINAPLFDDKEIQKPGLKINNSQILRTIVKWIECIEKLFFNTDQFFEKRNGESFKFKTCFERLSEQQQERFKDIIKNQYQNIQQLKQNQKELLDRLIDDLPGFINKYQSVFTYLPSYQYQVGLFTSIMTKGIHDAISQYLQELINKIIDIHPDYNLVYFDVYDLLRAKCKGTKEEILQVFKKLQSNKYFKIIRIKNRMKTSNQDFLINMKIKNSPIVCELQLCIASEKNNESDKQDYLNHFNHFLYQLERSRYGPICQSVILCSSLSDTISYFSIDNLSQKGMITHKSQQFLTSLKIKLSEIDDVKPNKRGGRASIVGNNQDLFDQYVNTQPQKQNKKKKYQLQIANHSLEPNVYSFICHSCKVFVQSFKTFVEILKSEACNYSVCGDCLLSSMCEDIRVKYLVGCDYYKYFEQVKLEEIKQNKDEFICVIEKSYNKKIVFLRYLKSKISGQGYVNFNYKYSTSRVMFDYKQLEDCYLFKFKEEVKRVIMPFNGKLFEKLKGKFEEKREKRPEFYLEDGQEPQLMKKVTNTINNNEKLKKLPMDILLLVKDFISKQEMIFTAFLLDSESEIKIVDIQPFNFIHYYQITIKQSIKENKLKELIQQRKKSWFYKNKDLNQNDIEKLQQQKLNIIQSLQCPKSLFTRLPCKLVNIKQIFLNDNHIQQIDLKTLNFTLLEKLEVMRNKLTKITGFSTCPQLVDLRISNNSLKQLDFRKVQWKWLQNLDIIDNPLQEIDGLSTSNGGSSLKAPELKNLYIGLARGKELDIGGLRSDNIFDFICQGNKHKKISIKYPPLKKTQKIKISNVNKLPFDQLSFPSLVFLALQHITLDQLILAQNFQFPKLQSIHISNCNIKSMFIRCNLTNLKQLKISKSCLEVLQFKEGIEFSELDNINLSHNLLRKLDFSMVGKIGKLEKLNLGYNLVCKLVLPSNLLKKLRIICLDHNPFIYETLMEYMQYGFTQFMNLQIIEFGFNMKKAQSLFWLYHSIHKLNSHPNPITTISNNTNVNISILIAKILEVREYYLLESIGEFMQNMELDLNENQQYLKCIESCHTFARLVEERGGEVKRAGLELYSAHVTDMK